MDNTEQRLKEWLGEDNQLGIDIWHKKYQYGDESFDEWLDRVSAGDKDIKEEIETKRFLFGGRILANRGLYKDGVKVTYSNCYVLPAPEDNIESIYDTAGKLARTFSYGGGVGIDISKLAPRGARVNNTAKETSGAVSFMDLYGMTTGLIGQNGRRGALMISMDCRHPDLEEFIDIKSDLDKVTTANISVRVDDDFIRAVRSNDNVTLSFTRPETDMLIKKEVNARELFHKLAYNNWDMGEPGILFWDNIKSWNMLSNDDNFEYAGTNPCLTGDTLIQTTEGLIPIKDLVGTTPDVYCMDDNGQLAISKATKVWKTRENANTVTVITGKGNIRCTSDHLIYTMNRGWVKACELKKGDKIKGLNRSMKDETHVSVALSGTKYMAEHRFVMNHYADINGYDVHHIDGDTFNNTISNLEVLEHGAHSALTNKGRKIEVNRDDKTGRFLPKEIKAKKKSINQGKKVGTNWYVQEVRWEFETEDVYDITVPEYHNFIANDMVVHNCAEEPLPAGGSCLLGSINLSEFVCDPYTDHPEFDIATYRTTIRRAVRALNDVLDEGLPLHPLQIQRDTVRDWRQIGLGVFGIADMLVKMGLDYGSEKARKFCIIIADALASTAISESIELASLYGTYPKYTEEVFSTPYIKHIFHEESRKRYAQVGLRNSQLLTIAPTGTLSTMLGVSGGIEPFFATEWERTTKSLHGEDVVYKEHPRTIEELLKAQDTDIIPDYVVTSGDIKPIDRIKMQAVWQKYIDASISSTINLPNDTTPEEVADIYMQAWKHGLKGVTVFRDGCRRVAILNAPTKDEDGQLDDENIKTELTALNNQLRRGDILDVSDDLLSAKRTLVNGCGKMYLHLDFDEMTGEPLETWIECGSGGGCERNLTFISRLISVALRGGIPIEAIIDQAMSVKPCKAYCDRTKLKHDTSRGTSCPQSIGYAMEELYHKIQDRCFADDGGYEYDELNMGVTHVPSNLPQEEIREKVGNGNDNITYNDDAFCPECGAKLQHQGGCVICAGDATHEGCGWSRCG